MEKLSENTLTLINNEMAYWRIPGAAIAVIKDGKLQESIGFGYRNLEENLPVTADTQFGIASCSKSMTSALIAILVDKRMLDYDEPVTTYAPKLIMYDPAAKGMTLRDMMTHHTGFGAHDAIWPGNQTRDDLAGCLRYIKPCTNFRDEAIYSNVIFAMVGYVAECATGEPWDKLMQEYLFDPLGMKRTNCSVKIMQNDMDYAIPYRYRNGKSNPLKLWNVDLAGPAASVNSTANDMAKWLMMHIAGGKTEDGSILIQPETFQEMHKSHTRFEDSIGIGEGFFECHDYAMGWRTGTYHGHAFNKHSGKIEGYSSNEAYLPDDGIGVAILTNFHSPSVPFIYGVLYTVLDEMLGQEPEDWIKKFHGEELPAEEDYLDCDVNYFKEEQILGTQPTLPLNQYAGIYHDNGYGTIKIIMEDNELYMQYRDMNLPLKHFHYDVFRADDVKEDILTITLPVSFTINNGRTEAVSVRFEPKVSDIIFKIVD